jgi:putative tryptophan/tyrosine transport system substrate-binding protein
MPRRASITAFIFMAGLWPFACYAQEPNQPLKRVGLLTFLKPCPLAEEDAVARGLWDVGWPEVRRLGELGWVEGRNVVFDCVSAVGRLDQGPTLARELVSRRPDVVMAGAWTLLSALKRETATIPIVMLPGWEPVRLGLVSSLARPERNVTGVAWFGLLSKEMELLKEIVPHLKRVAYIGSSVDAAYSPPEASKIGYEQATITATTLGFRWQVFRSTVASDYDEIFARLAAEHFDAAYISSTPFNLQNSTRIGRLALSHLIPAVNDQMAKDGLLLTYGQDPIWSGVRAMDYVDKILRGAKPSDLPVEQATKIQLTINLKTAKALGLTVPPSLLARADEVIE